MKRIGYTSVRQNKDRHKKLYCHNCGRPGKFKVVFRDSIGLVVVTLCEKCLWKDYRELKLQRRLDFPLTGGGEKHG